MIPATLQLKEYHIATDVIPQDEFCQTLSKRLFVLIIRRNIADKKH